MMCFVHNLQDLPRLRDLEIIFGHELSDGGISHIAVMVGIQRLKLVNFIRLHDHNINVLSQLTNLEDLVIQASNQSLHSGARVNVLPKFTPVNNTVTWHWHMIQQRFCGRKRASQMIKRAAP